ncbi:MAG TPA: hypothetical protein VK463_04960, partial [Desulfomonilaceae bacterium]|nr:hypothetical protein [Desulfomonilaceae bacterium]
MTEQTTNSFIFSSEGEGLTVTPNLASLSEETIDLGTLFVDSVSPTGSFDLRRSRLSSFGKLLEAIPIPTMLVDESYHIIFANRACNRPGIECGKIEGSNFS